MVLENIRIGFTVAILDGNGPEKHFATTMDIGQLEENMIFIIVHITI